MSGISGVLGQREGRVPVGAERADRVVLQPPGLPQHAHVELEDRPRVAAGDHDRRHLARMADIVDAVAFLLRNPAVNGVSLNVDDGTLLG